MTEREFLETLLGEIKDIKEDLHESSVKFSRLNVLQKKVEDRLESIESNFDIKINKQLEKKLTDKEKEYVMNLIVKAEVYDELADPICESDEIEIKGQVYFCRREAFVNKYELELTYGFTIYKWDGTYFEVDSPTDFKFKNWQEVFHCVSCSKVKPDEMLKSVITRLMDN